MPIERLTKFDSNSMIITLMYREAKKHAHDGQWRRYESTIKHAGQEYRIEADFVLGDAYLTYKNLTVIALERSRIVLN